MGSADKINLSKYSYLLPDQRIAKYPLPERDQSRLLIYNMVKKIYDDIFINLYKYLPSGSLLVYNNTMVIYARLHFSKNSGAEIEIFCLKPVFPADYELIFRSTTSCRWECLIGNLKRWKSEVLTMEIKTDRETVILKAKKAEKLPEEGIWIIEFSWDNPEVTFACIIESAGEIPIPPYLKRKAEESDKIRYQTVFSRMKGSVAAPTAGLHFTGRVFESLKANHVKTAEITLHVGAGTFRPFKTTEIAEHRMHSEEIRVSSKVLAVLKSNADNIIATGTTTVRALESIYWLGVKLANGYNPERENVIVGQWEIYSLPDNLHPHKSIQHVIEYLDSLQSHLLIFSTSIMIIPGYHFKMIKGMITNFHQPQSTLLLLIAAFVGDDWKRIYNFALDNGFRFLSYGDASLLLR